MLEHVHRGKIGGISQSQSGVPVPWSAIHACATVLETHDDAVVAQHARARAFLPQARRRALPRPGMSNEKTPAIEFVHDPNSVNFHAFAARKPVNGKQFIEWIFDRVHGLPRIEIFTVKRHLAMVKIAVKPGCLVRRSAEKRRRKIKTVAAPLFEERPEAAGMKHGLAAWGAQIVYPIHIKTNIKPRW